MVIKKLSKDIGSLKSELLKFLFQCSSLFNKHNENYSSQIEKFDENKTKNIKHKVIPRLVFEEYLYNLSMMNLSNVDIILEYNKNKILENLFLLLVMVLANIPLIPANLPVV